MIRTLIAGLLLLPAAVGGQQPGLAEADRHFQAGAWPAAAAAYEAVLRADSTQALAWYRLGRIRYEQGRHGDAIVAYHAAARHRFTPPVFVQFGIARAQAALGERDAAFATLDAIAQSGFRQASSIAADTAFAALHADARMQAVLARVERNAAPCRYAPEARQFDFWIGTWDVFHPVTGQKLGENRIEEHLNGCLLQENWTGGMGSSGKSMNFYDPAEKTWRQVWVADGYNVLDYTAGEYRDGAMRFQGRTRSPQGAVVLQRLTFHHVAADTVRQVFESSRDDGATWTEDWVGIYIRRK